MPIDLACPSCRKMLQVPDYAAGKKARCPSCGEVIAVPARERTVNPYESPSSKPKAADDEETEFTAPAGELDIGVIWHEAWEAWKNNLGVFVAATLTISAIVTACLVLLFAAVFAIMAFSVENPGTGAATMSTMGTSLLLLTAVLGGLFWSLLTAYLTVGMVRISLDASRGLPVKFSRLFSGGDVVAGFWGFLLLFQILTQIGMYLCVIPGIWMSLAWWPGFFLIADRRCNGGEALSYAQKLTRGNILKCFVISVIGLLVYLVGYIALGVGLLFALPLITVLFATTYRHLAGDPKQSEATDEANPFDDLDDSPFA